MTMTSKLEGAEDGAIGRDFGSVKPQELVRVIEERDVEWLMSKGGPSGVAKILQSSATEGLDGNEVESAQGLEPRKAWFGENRFKYPPPKGFLRLMIEAFNDVTIIILCVAAVVSLAIGLAIPDKREHFGYLEGVAIVLVVMIVVLVQASIDYQKEMKFRQLNSVKDNYTVQAIRAGQAVAVSVDEVVVGDIVKVSQGDKLAADGLLVEGSKVKTNESAMTGEVIDIEKSVDGDPFMLSGTTVSEGVGLVLIIAVGERSQWGTILAGLIVEPEDTPLQQRLDRLAWNIGKLGILFAVLTFIVSMIRWGARSARAGRVEDGAEVLNFFIDSVTIVVVAIPEGLPLAITLGLAFAMRKMMTDKNLVRRLEACETMGSATQLNADKTGTLTQNRMTVVEAQWSCAAHVNYENDGTGPKENGDGGISDVFRNLIASAISVNSQASLQTGPNGQVEHLGSKTECALLQLVVDWGMSYAQIRHDTPPDRIYLFDSTKKRMSSTIDHAGATRLFTKGAPEIVVRLCTRQLDLDGVSTRPLDRTGREDIIAQVDSMASRGLRTLLLAYRDVEHPKSDEEFWKDAPETDLTYLGVVGIKDPIRPETKEAVRLLKGAGVTVRMVTGDNPLTAKFIAQEAGILDDDGIVMQGPEFRRMTPEEMDAVAIKIQVLARSTPNDKLILVREHKKLGEVVSVTGDGTNDAPALKEADVGFALGVAGTEIAKEACDIVILDDNIQSMAKAVLWGRNVYESIRKFLQFQLVVNVVAVSLNFIAACAGVPLPLSPVPLLWVNMIMDSMGALALATEPPRPQLMERKPFGRRAPLINRAMYRNIIGVSIYQLVVCLVLQFLGQRIFGLSCTQLEDGPKAVGDRCSGTDLEINSIIFNTFVFMQVASEVNSRRIVEKNVFAGILNSYMFLGIIAVTIGIQVAIMLGVGGTQVGITIGIGKINNYGWLASIVLGALVLPWGAIVRLWPLEWGIGPTDEDPTEMSKLEKLLHFPKRKPPVFDEVSDEAQGIVDGSTPTVPPDNDLSMAAENDNEKRQGEDGDDQPNEDGQESMRARPLASEVLARQHSKHAISPAKVRLRVFVHAVAFVNVVRRGVSRATEDSRRIENGETDHA